MRGISVENPPNFLKVLLFHVKAIIAKHSRNFHCHRFAFHDYNRLAAEDERDVGDSTDIDGGEDWIVTDDDEDSDDVLGRLGQDGIATAEAPF